MKRSIYKKLVNKGVAILFVATLVIMPAASANANENASAGQNANTLVVEEAAAVIESISASYKPWKSVEFSGKLRNDKLPLSPTVKIYMVCDSLVQISLRVPLMGEIGRIELTRQKVLAVNKMKRVYVEESAAGFLEKYPGGIADLQSLLLARVVFPGSGELKPVDSVQVAISEVGNDEWLVLPIKNGEDLPGFNYGYLVGKEGRTHALVASYSSEGSAEITYGYQDKGLQIGFNIELTGKKPIAAELDFNSVKWGGNEMSPLRVSSYRRVGFREFLSSM